MATLRRIAYHASGLVVVEVHLFAEGPTALARVDELAAEFEAVANVVGTAAPLPVAYAGHRSRAQRLRPAAVHVAVVARARLDAALGARARHCVRYGGACNCVDERRLSATCNTQTKTLHQ